MVYAALWVLYALVACSIACLQVAEQVDEVDECNMMSSMRPNNAL